MMYKSCLFLAEEPCMMITTYTQTASTKIGHYYNSLPSNSSFLTQNACKYHHGSFMNSK